MLVQKCYNELQSHAVSHVGNKVVASYIGAHHVIGDRHKIHIRIGYVWMLVKESLP